jgi:MoxR-like ATPase
VFQVVATRNNRHRAGTFPLPAPQLDRFLVSIEMSLPDSEVRAGILKQHATRLASGLSAGAGEAAPQGSRGIDLAQVAAWQRSVRELPASDAIFRYVIRLCDAIRHHPELDAAISNRGALAIMQAARAMAFLEDHEAVFPEDVKRAFLPAVLHRVEAGESEFDRDGASNRRSALRLQLEELLETVAVE